MKKVVARFDPYRNVNWKKAQEIFERPLPRSGGEERNITTRDLLLALAYFGTQAVIDIMEVRRRVAESTHPGLIDPEYEVWRQGKLLKQFEKLRYIRLEKDPRGRHTVKITSHGMSRALTYSLDTMTITKPKVWDGKWRVVMFDIPVRLGRIRDIFRKRLKQLELFQMQESVYVSPHPCFDEVEFLRELYGVTFTVRYLLVERIEDDGYLRNHFHLPK